MNDKATHEAAPKCHIILNTVSANHQVADYLGLLAKGGTIVKIGLVVGLDEKLAPTDVEESMRVGTQRAGEIGSKL